MSWICQVADRASLIACMLPSTSEVRWDTLPAQAIWMAVDNDSTGDRVPARVFVSYAHVNDQHKRQVLRLCSLLRSNGVDARLDRYDSNERRDWYTWYLDQVAQADYVLVIASRPYKTAGDGTAPASRNRGVQAEAAHLRDLLHADRPTWTRKLLPVVLPGATVDEIPHFLQPRCASHYLVTDLSVDGIEELLRTITSQPAQVSPALGDVPRLPPENVYEDWDGQAEADRHGGHVGMHVQASGQSRVYLAGRDQHIVER
jgi:TIR domain